MPGIPPADPNQYFTPTFGPEVPQEVQTHFRQLYLASSQHDQAIKLVHSMATTTTVVQSGGGGGVGPPGPPGPGSLPGLAGLHNQTGATTYTVATADNGALLILNDASPIAITLNSALTTPYFVFITNLGTGTATLTPSTGTVNGAASFALTSLHTAIAGFDGTNWFASATPVVPATFTAITSQWLRSYDATTGLFTGSQPAFTDITGRITTAQAPAAGLSVTITTAALTVGGTQGSMTYVSGILTAQTPAT